MQCKRDRLWLRQSEVRLVGLEWMCAGMSHSVVYLIRAPGRGCLVRSEDCQNPQLPVSR